ncbi:MAG: 50S ribosomal protein L6 [Alphaproteobacteria bacterium]|nr:50S ribosomal protein L6 [Alphaproteobacteria bacterium SS10]
MSRIGKHPVAVPTGVDLKLAGKVLTAKGKLGELAMTVVDDVVTTLEDGKVTITPANESRQARQMWATTRTLINNMVTGVSEGFQINLEIAGVGYRAAVQGKDLVLQLGFSHEVRYPMPDGIKIATPQPTRIEITGADKQRIGQVAAEIRSYRPPEPYKGKGIRYEHETILRKEGKKK